MGKNIAQKLIKSHLMGGVREAGREIALGIDRTLTQDATGTLVMLEFEAMNIPPGEGQDDVLAIDDVRNVIQREQKIIILNKTKEESYQTEHSMSRRQIKMLLAGSLINLVR